MKEIIEKNRNKMFMKRLIRKINWVFDNLPINYMDDETGEKIDEIIGVKLWLTKKGRQFEFIYKKTKGEK